VADRPFAVGQALKAIRENETRAVCIGLRVWRYRWSAFTISGIFAGLAGGLAGQLNRQVTPEQLHWVLSVEFVLGGTRHFRGPVVGAAALVALQEVSLRFTPFRGLILGGLLVVVVLACPEGLMGGGMVLITKMRGLGYRLGTRRLLP
jgi:branched-chain amino acid transport system permease protein